MCCGLWTLCHTIQHRDVLIIFPLNLQTITITRMLPSGEEFLYNAPTPQVSSSYVYSFGSYRVDKQTNKHTNDLKTNRFCWNVQCSTLRRWVTTLCFPKLTAWQLPVADAIVYCIVCYINEYILQTLVHEINNCWSVLNVQCRRSSCFSANSDKVVNKTNYTRSLSAWTNEWNVSSAGENNNNNLQTANDGLRLC